jgi:hypothetical protein
MKKTDANSSPKSQTLDQVFFPKIKPATTASVRVCKPSCGACLSRCSPPPRRHQGPVPWAPPPGRSTAARSPMGWTRAPARGRAAAPSSSTGHHGCRSFTVGSRFQPVFGGGFKELAVRGRGMGPGCEFFFLDRAAPLTAAGVTAGRGEVAGRPPPAPCAVLRVEEKMKGSRVSGLAAGLYTPAKLVE